jgi:hypothetical protein
VEKLKEALPDQWDKINDVCFLQQNKTTEGIVKAVKSRLQKISTKEQLKQEASEREEARAKQKSFYEKSEDQNESSEATIV